MSESVGDLSKAVYERTPIGQSEVLRAQLPLSDQERRLLSMLNGFTSLAQLQALLGPNETIPAAVVTHMLMLGVIKPAECAPDHHFYLGWPVDSVH